MMLTSGPIKLLLFPGYIFYFFKPFSNGQVFLSNLNQSFGAQTFYYPCTLTLHNFPFFHSYKAFLTPKLVRAFYCACFLSLLPLLCQYTLGCCIKHADVSIALYYMPYPIAASVAPKDQLDNLTRIFYCLLAFYSIMMSFYYIYY